MRANFATKKDVPLILQQKAEAAYVLLLVQIDHAQIPPSRRRERPGQFTILVNPQQATPWCRRGTPDVDPTNTAANYT
jgi:hypothetical protein